MPLLSRINCWLVKMKAEIFSQMVPCIVYTVTDTDSPATPMIWHCRWHFIFVLLKPIDRDCKFHRRNGIGNFPYARVALVTTNSKHSRKFEKTILNLRFHLIERLIRIFCYLFVVLNLLLLFISISLTLTLSFPLALSVCLSVCRLIWIRMRFVDLYLKRNNKAVRAFRGESVSITSTIDLRTKKKRWPKYVDMWMLCVQTHTHTCLSCDENERCCDIISDSQYWSVHKNKSHERWESPWQPMHLTNPIRYYMLSFPKWMYVHNRIK